MIFEKTKHYKIRKFFEIFVVRTVKIVVRTTSTSESTSFKTRYPEAFRVAEKSNLFDLVDSLIRRGTDSIVFRKFFQLKRFRSGLLH